MAEAFDTIEELRAALVEFARRYNETLLVPDMAIVPHIPRPLERSS